MAAFSSFYPLTFLYSLLIFSLLFLLRVLVHTQKTSYFELLRLPTDGQWCILTQSSEAKVSFCFLLVQTKKKKVVFSEDDFLSWFFLLFFSCSEGTKDDVMVGFFFRLGSQIAHADWSAQVMSHALRNEKYLREKFRHK